MGNNCCCDRTKYETESPSSLGQLGDNHYNEENLQSPTSQQGMNVKPKIVVALYNHESRDSQGLSFVKGDAMEVRDEADRDWWFVKHLTNEKYGYVPVNFVALEQSVESEDWFFDTISRKEAEKQLLLVENPQRGTFLIRKSEHDPNGYSLSVKDWTEDRGWHVKHYKIKPIENGGFYISSNKTYESLSELVSAYSINSYGLCHILSIPCRKPEPHMWDLSHTYRDKWEIPREDIVLMKKLGRGNFGEVYYGKWKDQCEVAVKTLREGTMSTQAFLQEAAIMKKFRHKRLVQLYGVCSAMEPVYIVQEYMEKGSLLAFLQNDRGKTLQFDDLVYIGYQVASGMAHLESLNFIHRDLAARNVLLGEGNIAKICDFGLARIMDDETYAAHTGKFPLKWTAPEALANSIFTVKSDVWSYGIFLMELFTFGVTPYEGIQPSIVFELVSSGYRMKKPVNLPDEIYEMMQRCWHELPERRPTFKSLERYFENMDVSYRNQQSVVLSHNVPNSYDDHNIKSPTGSVVSNDQLFNPQTKFIDKRVK